MEIRKSHKILIKLYILRIYKYKIKISTYRYLVGIKFKPKMSLDTPEKKTALEKKTQDEPERVITFHLRNGNKKAFISLVESDVKMLGLKSTYFNSITAGVYDQATDYDLTEYDITCFNLVILYLRLGKFPKITNDTDMTNLYKLALYLGMDDKFIEYVNCDTENLFERDLTVLDTALVKFERELRKELYGNEEKDFRSIDTDFELEKMKATLSKFIPNGEDLKIEIPSKYYKSTYLLRTKKIDKIGYYYMGRAHHSQPGKLINFPNFKDVSTLSFQESFPPYLAEIFDEFDFTDMCMAGGSCFSLATEGKFEEGQDIDLFIITKDEKKAEEAILRTLNHLSIFIRGEDGYEPSYMIRTENFISISGTYYDADFDKEIKVEFQIILRLYNSIAQVISGFDIDCCCVAYDGKQVYCTQRFIRSLYMGYNLVDPERQSQNYGQRLRKYFLRGIGLALPGFDPKRSIISSIESKKSKGLAKILHLVSYAESWWSTNSKVGRVELVDSFELDKSDYKPTKLAIGGVRNYLYWKSFNYIRYMEYKMGENADNELKYMSNVIKCWNNVNKEVVDKACLVDLHIISAKEEKTIEWLDVVKKVDAVTIRYLVKNIPPSFIYTNDIDDIMNGKQPDVDPEGNRYKPTLSGRIKFKTKNAGTQMTNSFNPTTEDWYKDLYTYV